MLLRIMARADRPVAGVISPSPVRFTLAAIASSAAMPAQACTSDRYMFYATDDVCMAIACRQIQLYGTAACSADSSCQRMLISNKQVSVTQHHHLPLCIQFSTPKGSASGRCSEQAGVLYADECCCQHCRSRPR